MIRKKVSISATIRIPSFQESLDQTPPPDPALLDGTSWDRKDYERQEDQRIKYRRWIFLEAIGIEERVLDTALSIQRQPEVYDKARALLYDPRFEEIFQALDRIREEETAVSRAWLEKQLVCVLCGGRGGFYRLDRVCEDCHRSRPSVPPARGILSALSRARQAKMPATLTDEEWQRTVDHFKDRCAYCGGPWCLIEHATPIPHGGTTIDNCLPACTSCNIQKGSATIEELEPTESVSAALYWLRTCGRAEANP